MALLGLGLHWCIALIWAAIYVVTARRVVVLTRRPVTAGLVYGGLIYLVMNFVVLPHTHAAVRVQPSGINLLNGVAAVVLLVGLVISLVNAAFHRAVGPRSRVSS